MTRSTRFTVVLMSMFLIVDENARAACAPGWLGTVLIDGESLTRWSVEGDGPAGPGTLQLSPGISGQAVRFNWTIGTGNWAQAKYTFPTPVNLSTADLIGLSLRGGGPGEAANNLRIVVADADGVFYGYTLGGGVNQIDRWLTNHSIPKKLFQYLWGGPGPGAPIDWTRIDRFFVSVQRPYAEVGGGSGQLSIDRVQYARSANWTRQTSFRTVTGGQTAAANAIAYIRGQQKPTGLIVSWKEEASPKAWLYDQAMALMALTRDGVWHPAGPDNASAQAAAKLGEFLAAAQKADGRWARTWNPVTGEELLQDEWVGDQAWCGLAVAVYATKSGSAAAQAAAQRSAAWLSARIDPSGRVSDSHEGTVDAWWALAAAGRWADADRVEAYLLNAAWEPDMKYWLGGHENPFIALDAGAAWTSAFARHPAVNRPDRALAALTFIGKTLATQSDDGGICGVDAVGPVSIWNEGMGQYVAAGGEGAQGYFNALLAQQRTDGSVPGSPNNWSTRFGWLTSWSGLAATSWLYFAATGRPFLNVPSHSASSAGQAPEKAFDGDMATRWESNASDPQWLAVDYGAPRWMDRVTLRWENAYARAYKVQVSNNGTQWTDVYSTTTGDGGDDVVVFPPVRARHVRMYGTQRGTVWAYSLWEMSASHAGPAHTASSDVGGAALAFDGNGQTRWASEFSDPQWLTVRYDQPRTIDGVTLQWETAYGRAYKIQVSNDGATWTDVYATTTGDGGQDVVTFPPVETRYVRMYGTERGTPWGYSLWEMSPTPSGAGAMARSMAAAPAPDAFLLGEVYAFPNPAGGGTPAVFHVEVGRADNVDLRVYDVTGRLVHETTVSGDPALLNDGQGLQYAYETPWNVSGVPPGVYLYDIRAQRKGFPDIRHRSKLAVRP